MFLSLAFHFAIDLDLDLSDQGCDVNAFFIRLRFYHYFVKNMGGGDQTCQKAYQMAYDLIVKNILHNTVHGLKLYLLKR